MRNFHYNSIMSRVENFIHAINERFLHGNMLDELNLLWKEMNEYPICKEIVKFGNRKGNECGKACVKGQEKCLCHLPRVIENKNECNFLLTSGRNKGNMCGKKCLNDFCKAHEKEKQSCTFILKNGETCQISSKDGLLCKRHSNVQAVNQVINQVVNQVVEPQVVEAVEAVEPQVIEGVEPQAVEHQAVEHQAVEPQVIQPQVAKTQVVKPQAVEHQVAKPQAVEPQVAKPLIAAKASGVNQIKVSADKCKTLLKNGANKGKDCGRNCVEGKNVCHLHDK